MSCRLWWAGRKRLTFSKYRGETKIFGMHDNAVPTTPPSSHSHLNVADYDSPATLAKHLLYLDKNPREYLSYFWWKDRYRAVDAISV